MDAYITEEEYKTLDNYLCYPAFGVPMRKGHIVGVYAFEHGAYVDMSRISTGEPVMQALVHSDDAVLIRVVYSAIAMCGE